MRDTPQSWKEEGLVAREGKEEIPRLGLLQPGTLLDRAPGKSSPLQPLHHRPTTLPREKEEFVTHGTGSQALLAAAWESSQLHHTMHVSTQESQHNPTGIP